MLRLAAATLLSVSNGIVITDTSAVDGQRRSPSHRPGRSFDGKFGADAHMTAMPILPFGHASLNSTLQADGPERSARDSIVNMTQSASRQSLRGRAAHASGANATLGASTRSRGGRAVHPESMVAEAPMRSTPQGHCMYELPSWANTDLQDSRKQRNKSPQPIAPRGPLLYGLTDTSQVQLDRIFFDRMTEAATEWRLPQECLSFYIPAFPSYEVSAVDGWWVNPDSAVRRQYVDDILTYLHHMGRFKQPPGSDHWIVLGRIMLSSGGIGYHPSFQHVHFLTPEAHPYGHWPKNQHAVPYPQWFRYDPALESHPGQGPIHIRSADPMNGTFQIPATNGSLPIPGQWNPIQELARSSIAARCDGQMACTVRVSEAVPLAASLAPGQLKGSYSCGTASTQYYWETKGFWKDQLLTLGCGKGPCWLWGNCHKAGPLYNFAVFVGHVRRGGEHARQNAVHQCDIRPQDCLHLETGTREFSTGNILPYIGDMDQVLLGSTFCINPPGDTPTRKGLFDSLVAGCIPVIFADTSLSLYKWHVPNWQDVSVLVPWEKLLEPGFNLIDHLKQIPQAEVQRKQDAIWKLAYSLQYSSKPAPAEWAVHPARVKDAFAVALEGLARDIR